MVKRNVLIASITIILIILLLPLYFLFVVEESIFGDDYTIEDDFTIPSPALLQESNFCLYPGGLYTKYQKTCTDTNWISYSEENTNAAAQCTDSSSKTTIIDGVLRLEVDDGKNVYVEYQKNLKGRDIKFEMSSQTDREFDIYFNDQKAYTYLPAENRNVVFNAIQDIENQNLYHILIDDREVNTVLVQGNQLKLKIGSFGRSGGSCRPNHYFLEVDNLKSRAFFSCKVDSDEVVIKDAFAEKTSFTINDLRYFPKKFCIEDYPLVRRSLTEKGVRTDGGTLLHKLALGETLTVPADNIYEVHYIVDYSPNVGPKCAINEALTQLKQCSAVIQEEADFVELVDIKKHEIVGLNNVLFQDNIKIGNNALMASSPQYSCQNINEKADAPNPQPTCWNSIISYKNEQKNINAKETIVLDEYFLLYYNPTAHYENGIVQPYVNNFELILQNRDILSIDIPLREATEEQYFVLFKANSPLVFEIDNKYSAFDNAGVRIIERKQLIQQEKIKTIEFPIMSGKQQYSFPIDASEYGIVEYEITLYFKINNVIFYDDETVIKNVEIVDTIPTGTSFVRKVADKDIISNILGKDRPLLLIVVLSFIIVLFLWLGLRKH